MSYSSYIVDLSMVLKENILALPEPIQRRFLLLLHQDRRITYLKYHLNVLESQYHQLKEEFTPYLAPMQQPSQELNTTTPVTYMDRLPDEILYIIFKKYLERKHHNIWKLLLVCRRWNRFIMGCPALWAKIQIDWGFTAFNRSPLYSPVPYITACVKRSRPALLEVDLDFNDFPSSRQFLINEIEDGIRSLNIRSLSSLLHKLDEQEMDWDFRFYELGIERLFDCLIGPNGEHMARWSSLTIDIPTELSKAEGIWTRFKGALPNLNTLSIRDFPEVEDVPFTEEIIGKGFMDLSSVTTLAIPNGALVSSHPISHATLQHLSMLYCANETWELEPLLALTGLRTLKLEGYEGATEFPVLVDDFIIHLPQLETLELSGKYSWLSGITFDLPKLEKLVVRTDGQFDHLPKLSPKSTSWKIYEGFKMNPKYVFDSILSVSPNLETITMTVPPRLQSRILKEIDRCRANESLISSPHVIICPFIPA